DIDLVGALAVHRAGMECHVQEDAGHAFDTHGSTMFYRPAAAKRAWRITEEFLDRTLRGLSG
ncbi:MAG: dienelactone hydrolase family protein, partial [Pseudonocardiaceae bacterium]